MGNCAINGAESHRLVGGSIMNVIGKILVILNFLFAVAVVALVVMYVSVRTPWKQAYLDLKRETDVLRIGRDTQSQATGVVTTDLKSVRAKNDELTAKLADAEEVRKAQAEVAKIEKDNLTNQLAKANLTLQNEQEAHKTALFEISGLRASLKESREYGTEVESKLRIARAEVVDYKQK